MTQWSNQNASRGNCSSTPGSPGELAHKPARDPLFGVCILVLFASGRVPQNFPLAARKKGQRGKEKPEERPTALCSTDPAISEHRSRNTPEAQLLVEAPEGVKDLQRLLPQHLPSEGSWHLKTLGQPGVRKKPPPWRKMGLVCSLLCFVHVCIP